MCQVDLLVQTKYSIYVCEIKFRRKIPKNVIDEMYAKISRMEIPKTMSIRPVLIYEGSLSNRIREEDFFDHIIHFADFLVG